MTIETYYNLKEEYVDVIVDSKRYLHEDNLAPG